MADESEGGNEGGKPQPVKKLKNLTVKERRDWNDFLDSMQKDRIGGNKDLDQPDKNVGTEYIEKYKKENPGTSVNSDMIARVQNDQQQLRSGESFADMTPEQTRILRKQLSPEYLNRPVPQGAAFGSALSRMYYPEFKKGDKNYGTDAEGYFKDFVTRPAEGGGGSTGKGEEDIIPLPDFKNAKSRGQFTANFKKKYSDIFNDVPIKIQYAIGDIPLNVNQIPRGAKDTSKNIVQKYGKEYGIDPALLYTSFMVEGGSGLYKSEATGLDTRNRKPGDIGYQGFYGDKEFPINGPESFGFTTFSDRFPELVKGGYLPKDFEKEFRGKKGSGEFGQDDFKSVESAMQGKAALMKFSRDEVDEYAKKHDIELSPKAREFFMLAAFNGGEGGYMKRMLEYKKQGLLDDDKFLKKRPEYEEHVKGTTADVWGHVVPRMRIRSALKKERQFEDENDK